jgi:tetratricopeptide (TPR) repeat protein
MQRNQPANNEPADELKFRYVLPTFPEGRPVTAAEAENILLDRLTASDGSDINALYQLAALYSRNGLIDQAEECVHRLLEINQEPGGAAVHFLQLGQLGEKTGAYEYAAKHYLRGLEAGPVDTHTRYFLRNNLGYTLNQLGRFAEAEPLLREAIQVDPERTNAYKNLGLCLWGLERHVEAAVCFINATRVNAADSRSLHHLQQLFAQHPEIANSIPDFDTLLSACRGAVSEAARHRPDLEAWWWQARKEATAP